MKETPSIPAVPIINEEDLRECRAVNDYRPILFQWYKYVGSLSNFLASLHPQSPALRPLNSVHYALLIGLLNRCSRLMLANARLVSDECLFGETTMLIDRCIFESTVKISWLCHKGNAESFDRLIADGLKTEIALKERINRNIQERGGQVMEIENRMLLSIERMFESSGLSEAKIGESKKLQDLATMIEDLGHHRTIYVSGQKMGSHHIHGTWPSLLSYYLISNDAGVYGPRDHDCPTHVNQFILVPLFVLSSIEAFIRFVFINQEEANSFLEFIDSVREEIIELHREAAVGDFELKTEGAI